MSIRNKIKNKIEGQIESKIIRKRLYVAIYPNADAKDDRERWKNYKVPGCRIRAKSILGNSDTKCQYMETRVQDVRYSPNLLGRILIGKIADERRLLQIAHTIPTVHTDPAWPCSNWSKDFLKALESDGKAISEGVLDWDIIEAFGRAYVGEKVVSGRYDKPNLAGPRPTWNLLNGEEIIA